MKQWVKWSAALILACLSTASPAYADNELIELDYRPGLGCPDRKQFLELVQAITSKMEIANDAGAPRRKFGIRVSRSGNLVNGELTIDDQAAQSTRSVVGATCDEVISALALATALAVDPDALGAPAVAVPEPPPVAPIPAPEPPKPPAAKPTPPTNAARGPAAPARRDRPLFDLGVGARASDNLAPFAKLDLFAELGSTYYAPLELHFGVALGPQQHDRQTQFSDWLGWAGVGYRLADLEPVSVWAETSLELGRVQAQGRNISPASSADKAWAAVDVGLCARLDGPGRLFLQVVGGGRAPLLLQRYVVLQNTGKLRELHQVGQLGYLLSLSVGMHFL